MPRGLQAKPMPMPMDGMLLLHRHMHPPPRPAQPRACPAPAARSQGAVGGGQRVCGAAGGSRHSARGEARFLLGAASALHCSAAAVQARAWPTLRPLVYPGPRPRLPTPPPLPTLQPTHPPTQRTQPNARQVVMLCCSIKPLCGWNNEDCATTCRERCGGQGYLSCNRFGSILGFAHAGGWAAGDQGVAWVQSGGGGGGGGCGWDGWSHAGKGARP